uniref:Uncharacterized protein n=1 Tax=Pseudonaja textilis TaxID=8673 RepID=A0A670YAN3_PSETE
FYLVIIHNTESPLISFSGVDACLSSLKTCKTYINTGMDITTNVALDLVENHSEFSFGIYSYVMLEYAVMNRELSHYVQAVEDTIKQDKSEVVPDLRHLVMERFRNLESKNCNADLQRNEKVVLFKEQIQQMKAQGKCGFIAKLIMLCMVSVPLLPLSLTTNL